MTDLYFQGLLLLLLLLLLADSHKISTAMLCY
jgi:hypothetical protein